MNGSDDFICGRDEALLTQQCTRVRLPPLREFVFGGLCRATIVSATLLYVALEFEFRRQAPRGQSLVECRLPSKMASHSQCSLAPDVFDEVPRVRHNGHGVTGEQQTNTS